jgi:exonuclease SbcC
VRITTATGKNFQSYADVEFDYSNVGLALIGGQMKSGKSTLMDLVSWTLYGQTSKESAADDVRSWFAENDVTEGVVRVELGTEVLIVTRRRGKSSSKNDFFFQVEGTDEIVRGKDARNDTQAMLNERLGIDAELFIAASYLHQFSRADQFFLSKAKDRRETLERIADQSFAITIGEKMSESRKSAKKRLDEVERATAHLEGKVEMHKRNVESCESDIKSWHVQWKAQLNNLNSRAEGYEADKAKRVSSLVDKVETLNGMVQEPSVFGERLAQSRHQLKALEAVERDAAVVRGDLSDCNGKIKAIQTQYAKYAKDLGETCPTCLGPANNPHKEEHLASLIAEVETLAADQIELEQQVEAFAQALSVKPKLQSTFQTIVQEESANKLKLSQIEDMRAQLIVMRSERNPYEAQIADHQKKTDNPFIAKRSTLQFEQKVLIENLASLAAEIEEIEHLISSLTWLYEKSFDLRGQLLESAVKQIEDRTNDILERFFDAELRVKFSLPDSDKLEVEIWNEGYPCPFKQLSGGERTLLCRSFSFAYMKAAENAAGVKIDQLMLDEVLNGLDADMKIKAFNLLQSLCEDYSSIFLIDHHAEFQNLFPTQFLVTKSGVYSKIERVQS